MGYLKAGVCLQDLWAFELEADCYFLLEMETMLDFWFEVSPFGAVPR